MGVLVDFKKRLGYLEAFRKRKLAHLNLQILYNCNFTCKICDFWKQDLSLKPQMTAAQALIVSDKVAQMHPMLISIGGGEPLLHKELIEIAQVLCKHHLVVMITNGWLMTREKARALWQAGLYEVSVSIDYLDPAKHDANRGMPGAWNKGLEALKILNEERIHPHQRVHMITVVMDDNWMDVEPLIQVAKSIGVTYLVTFYSTGRGVKEARTPAGTISKHLLDIKKRNADFVSPRGYLKRYAQASSEKGVHPCRAGLNFFNVDCTGNVSLCIDTLDQSCGNILTDDMEIIKKRLIESHKTNDCGACWTSCRGPIETIMYGDQRLLNIVDFYHMTKDRNLI